MRPVGVVTALTVQNTTGVVGCQPMRSRPRRPSARVPAHRHRGRARSRSACSARRAIAKAIANALAPDVPRRSCGIRSLYPSRGDVPLVDAQFGDAIDALAPAPHARHAERARARVHDRDLPSPIARRGRGRGGARSLRGSTRAVLSRAATSAATSPIDVLLQRRAAATSCARRASATASTSMAPAARCRRRSRPTSRTAATLVEACRAREGLRARADRRSGAAGPRRARGRVTMPHRVKVVVTGATGFIGTALVAALRRARRRRHGAHARRRSRATRARRRSRVVEAELESRRAVVAPRSPAATRSIHLAGEPIAGQRWDARQKQLIRD